MKKTFLAFFIFTLLVLPLISNRSLAATSGGAVGGVDKQLLEELDKANVGGQFSTKDPRLIIADIIKTLLSVLGVIFLVLTVFAGFLWMTAAGDEKKVEKAQSIIKMAIIGLAVVLLSYSITLFVTYWLQVAAA